MGKGDLKWGKLGEKKKKQQNMKRPRADCDSDHEFLITKFRLKLKKVGKTTSLSVMS